MSRSKPSCRRWAWPIRRATHEAFVLKRDDALRAQYLAADTAGRRKLLDGPVDAAPAAGAAVDHHIDTIEWFASSADLCRAMVSLRDMAARPGLAHIMDTLSINPLFKAMAKQTDGSWQWTDGEPGQVICQNGKANIGTHTLALYAAPDGDLIDRVTHTIEP